MVRLIPMVSSNFIYYVGKELSRVYLDVYLPNLF